MDPVDPGAGFLLNADKKYTIQYRLIMARDIEQ